MTTDPLESRVLRYAYAQGSGRLSVSGAAPARHGERNDRPDRAGRPRTGVALPRGTSELLARIPYPAGRAAPDTASRLEHALITAFGLQRAELSNPYFEHRSVASVRSLFPVQAFVTGRGRQQRLDVHRHSLLDTTTPGPAPSNATRRVVLAGRYTRLPAFYDRLRGTLTELELGIGLRSLAVAFELFGLAGSLSLPTSGELLTQLGLSPGEEWTWPLTVAVDDSLAPHAAPCAAPDTAPAPDPATPSGLVEISSVNRAQARSAPRAPAPITPAAPNGLSARPASWGDVLWERSSGRMPRGLTGMAGRRHRVSAASFTDAAAWAGLTPPGEELRRVADHIRISAAVQATDGHEDGLYDITQGRPILRRRDTGLLNRLERAYGYGLAPGNGCDVRHAAAVWVLSVRPRALIAELGPGAWTFAQYAAGWAAHGLCLNAAAHGLYARPVRAFDGLATQSSLALAPDESVLLAVITGTPRFTEPLLDLRI